MDLRQLEYLVAVADHGSFTAAARALHVSQPTLSHGVRTLEAEVGVELFARLGRSVAITAAGSEVIDAARRVVRDMADVTAAAASVAALETGTVELAALPTLAVDPLAGILGRFRQRHPAVSVRVLEPEDAATVEHAVRSGRAELGLTDIGVGGRGLVRQALGRQEIVLVAPPQWDHLPDTVTAKELVALALVATPVGTSTRRLLDLTVARSGREPTSPWRSIIERPSLRSCSPVPALRCYRRGSPPKRHGGGRSCESYDRGSPATWASSIARADCHQQQRRSSR